MPAGVRYNLPEHTPTGHKLKTGDAPTSNEHPAPQFGLLVIPWPKSGDAGGT